MDLGAHVQGMATPPVPFRHSKQTRFLAALAQGKTPARAAALTDVPLATFYTWRTKHTRFREAWKKAVAHAQTPPFPSAAQLSSMNLDGPRTHWFWFPGGAPGGAKPVRPGDRVVRVLRSFRRDPDLVIFSTAGEDGIWIETSRASSREPMPEGFDHPAEPIPRELAARLPPLGAGGRVMGVE